MALLINTQSVSQSMFLSGLSSNKYKCARL